MTPLFSRSSFPTLLRGTVFSVLLQCCDYNTAGPQRMFLEVVGNEGEVHKRKVISAGSLLWVAIILNAGG